VVTDQLGDMRSQQPIDACLRVAGAELGQDRQRVNDVADG